MSSTSTARRPLRSACMAPAASLFNCSRRITAYSSHRWNSTHGLDHSFCFWEKNVRPKEAVVQNTGGKSLPAAKLNAANGTFRGGFCLIQAERAIKAKKRSRVMVNYSGPFVGHFSWDTVSSLKGTTTNGVIVPPKTPPMSQPFWTAAI